MQWAGTGCEQGPLCLAVWQQLWLGLEEVLGWESGSP